TPEGEKCQDAIGRALSYVISSVVLDVATCEKTINANKGVLPPGTCEAGNVGASCLFDSDCDSSTGSGDGFCPRSCSGADLKGKPAVAIAKAQALIASICTDATVQEVGPCNPPATTVAQAQTCVVANATTATKTVAKTIFFERQQSCPTPSGAC